MKKIFLLFMFLFSSFAFSQNYTLNAVNFNDSIDMYQIGLKEGQESYKGGKVIFKSAFTSLLPFGLLINGIMLSLPPKINKNKISNLNSLQKEDYINGYQKSAAHKRNKKMLIGTGIGIAFKAGLLIYTLNNCLQFSPGSTGWGP